MGDPSQANMLYIRHETETIVKQLNSEGMVESGTPTTTFSVVPDNANAIKVQTQTTGTSTSILKITLSDNTETTSSVSTQYVYIMENGENFTSQYESSYSTVNLPEGVKLQNISNIQLGTSFINYTFTEPETISSSGSTSGVSNHVNIFMNYSNTYMTVVNEAGTMINNLIENSNNYQLPANTDYIKLKFQNDVGFLSIILKNFINSIQVLDSTGNQITDIDIQHGRTIVIKDENTTSTTFTDISFGTTQSNVKDDATITLNTHVYTLPSGITLENIVTVAGTSGNSNDIAPLFTFQEICFPPFTLIETENGFEEIQNLTRGDMIVTHNGLQPLAKLMKTSVLDKTHKFVKFPAHCFTLNCPEKDTYCTPHHPVGINFQKVPALHFIDRIKGVNYEKIECNAYYNLQFDTPEWLTIQGMTFSSHHPQHEIFSLEEEEYVNSLNFKSCKYNEENDLHFFNAKVRNLMIN